MTRIVFQSLLLFVLPFLCFGGWLVLTRRGGRILESAPWFWLTVVGMVLAIGGLAALVVTDAAGPGGTYVPPHLDPSGRIVPGTVVPDARAP